MTINNSKKTPVAFDKNRHYAPDHKPLSGVEWTYVEKPEHSGNFVKIEVPISVHACPIQVSDNLFVSRLRENPDQGEWVTR